MAVQKGQKRGSYQRSADKRKRADEQEISEDGMTLQEIAKILDLPLHVVKRIEIDALRKLQAPTSKNKELHKYWQIGEKPSDRVDI